MKYQKAKIQIKNQKENLSYTYSEDLESHSQWLMQFGDNHFQKWNKLRNNNIEAAICEVLTKKFLSDNQVSIKPNDLNGGPDFSCHKKGQGFYVEVTCLEKQTVTKATALEDTPESDTGSFGLLTRPIFSLIKNKTPQCSGLEAPCLLAIGTLHFRAGTLCFDKHAAENLLTGTPKITVNFDTIKGRASGEPYETTELADSAFVRNQRNNTGQMEYARNPISGLLLCQFASRPKFVIGLLHPNPNYDFNRSLLTNIQFGSLTKEHKKGLFSVEWKKYNEDGSCEIVPKSS